MHEPESSLISSLAVIITRPKSVWFGLLVLVPLMTLKEALHGAVAILNLIHLRYFFFPLPMDIYVSVYTSYLGLHIKPGTKCPLAVSFKTTRTFAEHWSKATDKDKFIGANKNKQETPADSACPICIAT